MSDRADFVPLPTGGDARALACLEEIERRQRLVLGSLRIPREWPVNSGEHTRETLKQTAYGEEAERP